MKTKYKIHTAVSETILDLVTPLSSFLRIREHFPDSVLLESTDRKGGKKEFSYLSFDPIAEFSVQRDLKVSGFIQDDQFSYSLNDGTVPKKQRLETALSEFIARLEVSSSDTPGFINGLVGFISYDAVELMEDIEFSKTPNEIEDIPLAYYRLFRFTLVFDHQAAVLYLLQNEIDKEIRQGEEKRIFNLIQTAPFQVKSFKTVGEVSSNLSDAEHIDLIKNCQQHIKRGDVFQIVPSRKYMQSYTGDDLNVYRALRIINPSPHLFYYKTPNFTIFGSSPEAQIQIANGSVYINPIAGTYKRTGDDVEDEKAAISLSEDPKEVSEHVMLVDLARNDLSVHCYPVEVERFKQIEFYSHVIHLVSTVRGQLLPGKTSLGAFCATAPAGTLTGAPKFKAMELLNNYEIGRRHFYGGAIGVIGLNGDMIHAIMIRSFLSRAGQLVTQAGSGVVAESIPESEVQEVKNKLAALWAAVEKARAL